MSWLVVTTSVLGQTHECLLHQELLLQYFRVPDLSFVQAGYFIFAITTLNFRVQPIGLLSSFLFFFNLKFKN